jgi:hypothetical protein
MLPISTRVLCKFHLGDEGDEEDEEAEGDEEAEEEGEDEADGGETKTSGVQLYEYDVDFMAPASLDSFVNVTLANHKQTSGSLIAKKYALPFLEGCKGTIGRMFTKERSTELGEEGRIFEKEVLCDFHYVAASTGRRKVYIEMKFELSLAARHAYKKTLLLANARRHDSAFAA